VGPRLDNAPPLENENPVRMKNRREPVRNHDGDDALARRNLANRLTDCLLGDRVERRGRLIEHQQMRPAKQGASNREPLSLATRYLHASFPDHRVEAAIGAGEQSVTRRLPQRIGALVVGSEWIHKQQVLADRPGEELRILRDEADLLPDRVEIDGVTGDAVVQDASRLRRV